MDIRKILEDHREEEMDLRTDKSTLFMLTDMPIRRRINVRASENPYLNPEYFKGRKHNEILQESDGHSNSWALRSEQTA